MHTVAHLLEPGQIKGFRRVLFYQSVYLLSHRQGRCIALPVPLSPAVLREVEVEPIVYQAFFTRMVQCFI
jgi:hypothetical protein